MPTSLRAQCLWHPEPAGSVPMGTKSLRAQSAHGHPEPRGSVPTGTKSLRAQSASGHQEPMSSKRLRVRFKSYGHAAIHTTAAAVDEDGSVI